MNFRDKYRQEFERRGFVVVPHRTTKFVVMHNPRARRGWVFLGRSGAVRYGCDDRVTESWSLDDPYKRLLLAGAELRTFSEAS